MIFRPTVEAGLERLLPLLVAEPACGLTAATYRARLADGEYRPAWTWIAEPAPGAAPLALAVWWGSGPGEVLPGALDAVFVHGTVRPQGERTALAAGLLTAAHAAYAGAGTAGPSTPSSSPATGTSGPRWSRARPGGGRRPGAPV